MESDLIEQSTTWNLSFFVGPKDEKAMAPVDPRLEQLLDYSGILAPLARVLLWVLNYLYEFLHNYGWAIVVMTILINLLLLPLNLKSAQGMKKYTEFQKKLEYIKKKYKDDPDTLSREQAALITKHGMPGLGGCLPKLLQLPIFFALSRVLSNSIQLYQAPFLWIKDLSSKDPYYILPIAIVISMIIQSTATDPKQRFTMMAVALVFGAVAANFSAGLCLYILVGIILMNIQTYVQQKFNWA
jgi:YidC/Oxa1 family membrane protein insertase